MNQKPQKMLFWCLQVLAVGWLGLGQTWGVQVASAQETEVPSLIVTTTSDTTANDGETTLREAIGYARTLPAAQSPIVTFAPGVTGTITLLSNSINMSRPLGSKLTISGPGASVLSLDGNAQGNILYSDSVGNGAISGLTFTNGLAFSGGAIEAETAQNLAGVVDITDCVFTNNHATYEGGAVNGGCVLRLLRCSFINNISDGYQGAVQFLSYPPGNPSGATDCVFSGNTAGGLGGAVAVYSDGETVFDNCVFNNNSTTGQNYNEGGAVQINTDFYNPVTFIGCTFTNNTSSGQGGAINAYDSDIVTLTDTVINNNRALRGGGISTQFSNAINFVRSTLTDNTATGNTTNGNGGGIYALFPVSFTDSTVAGNTTNGNGGGIYTEAEVNFTNSTVSGNTALGTGGGVYLYSATQSYTRVHALFATFTGNSASNSGGIYLSDNRTGTLAHSIVAGNIAATNPDVRGAFTSDGFNVIGDVGSVTGFLASDRTGTAAAPLDARLGALADNGGPTLTHALLAGSPALNLATPVEGITTDQRGVTRPTSGNVDAGAFEAPLVVVDLNGSTPGIDNTVTFTEGQPSPAPIGEPEALATKDQVGNLQSLSATITNLQDGAAESLAADTAGTGITGSYNATTGQLDLVGPDSVANFQQVLRTIRYANSSPSPHTTPRLIEVVAYDQFAQSQTAVATVNIVAVNNAPSVIVPTANQTTNQDTPLALSGTNNNGISVADLDAASQAEEVTISVQHGTLTLSGTSGLTFTQGDGTNDASMTFRGTIALVNAALNGIVYTPNANYSGPDTLALGLNDLGNTGTGGPLSATASLTITVLTDIPVATTGALISEFRNRGAAGSADDYIELYNTTTAPLNISGWSVLTAGNLVQTIPLNTILPARAHYLLAGSAYSLDMLAVADQTLSADIPDNSGLILRNAAGATIDAVAFVSSTLAGEGTLLPIAPTSNGEYAFVRDESSGASQDTNDNAADFLFVSTDAGLYNDLQSQLGPPSPSGLNSSRIIPGLNLGNIDTSIGENYFPNRERDSNAAGATLGTIIFRRKITNNTGRTIKRLRLRFSKLTTLGSPHYNPSPTQADLRVISSNGGSVNSRDRMSTINYRGTTLETSPAQPLGGGVNSALTGFTDVELPGGLLDGQSENFQFVFGVQSGGGFTAVLNIEALD